MRPLAEYAMLGRRQAILVALLCGFVPLVYCLSAATIALVTLRRGCQEGMLVLLWAMIPAAAQWMMGDPTPLLLMPSMLVLGLLLRTRESWQLVMLAAIGFGIVAQISLVWQTEYQAQIYNLGERFITLQLSQGTDIQMSAEEFSGLLLGFFGAYHTMIMILCLMLGRWWQACSVNPGGFQQEFQKLKLDPKAAAVILAAIVAGLVGLEPFVIWGNICSIVPMFVGLSVIHNIVALKKMGSGWLTASYIILIFIGPAILLLGLTDSVIDYRKRAREQQSS